MICSRRMTSASVASESRTDSFFGALLLASMLVFSSGDALSAQETPSVDDAAGCDLNPENTNCSEAVGASDPGRAGRSVEPSGRAGNPVDLMTGNKSQQETDFTITGAMLAFNRFYSSENANGNVGMGQGWHHTFAVSLYDAGNGSREIVQSNGARIRFKADGKDEQGRSIMRGNAQHYGYVVQTDTHHEWHLPDSRILVFQGSYLVRIDLPDQRRLEMLYRGGRLHSVTDETSRVLRFDYYAGVSRFAGYEEERFREQAGHLAKLTLPDGSVVEYDYDQNRNLSRVRYSDGTSREYHYESTLYPNHLTGITDRRGIRFSSWSYDDDGRAVSSEHAGGAEKVTFAYPDAAAVAKGEIVQSVITNSEGYTSTYTWQQKNENATPLLLSSEGAGCSTCAATGFIYTYDDNGRLVESVKTSLGNAVGQDSRTYRYDEQGRLSEIRRIDAGGNEHLLEQREYVNETSGLLARVTNRSVRTDEERVRELVYDDAGRPLSVTERGWSPVVNDAITLDADATALDAVTEWEPIERTIRYEYDSVGRLVVTDAPRDDVDDTLRIEWDERNRPKVIRSPGTPDITTTGFNALGQITSFRIGEQSPVTIEYGENNLAKKITHYGRTLRISYDAEGRLTGYEGPDGGRRYLEYDEAGQLVKIISADGSSTNFSQDSEGRTTEGVEFNRDGTVIRSVSTLYDALGRIAMSATQILGADGNLRTENVQRTHNEAGQLVGVTNMQTGDEMGVEYNAFGALAKLNEPGLLPDESKAYEVDINNNLLGDRITTDFEYDAAGNEIALTDTRGNRTLYLKDDFGRVVVHHSSDTGTTRYQYDLAGNRTQKIDADGDVTTYRWDAANRMVEKQRVDGLYTYTYDPIHGQLTESVAPETTEHFGYDIRGRLTSHERLIDNRSFVTTYSYDENGRLSNKSLPDGQRLRFHYVEERGPTRGNLLAITRETLFGISQETLVEQIDQDTGDGSGGYVAANGLRTTHTFSPNGSIEAIDIDKVLNLEYRFDEAGRIVGIDENGTLRRYGYSRLGLTMAEQDGSLYRFDYDAMGNRTVSSVEKSDGTVSATRHDYALAGQGNRLLNSTTLSANAEDASIPERRVDSQRFTPSGAPEFTGRGYRYEYDSAQRPVRVFENQQLLAEYAYSGFGQRIKKVVYRGDQKKVTYYLYDGHQLTAEIDSESGTFKQGIFLDGAPVAYLVGGDTYAVHSDHLGTPRIVTDENGERVWSADYEAFGLATVTTAITSASKILIDLPYRLPGQYFDAETGTHYNYLRDYDPATGRYITSDPIGLQGGLNTYAYALNNPLSLTDPLGLAPLPDNVEAAVGADSPPVPAGATEEAYTDKLTKVMDYAIADLGTVEPGNAALNVLTTLRDDAALMGVVMAAVAAAHAVGGPVAVVVDGIILAGTWLLVGYSAAKFLVDTVTLLWNLKDTELCDEAALQAMGNTFSQSVQTVAEDIAAGALMGGMRKIGNALKDASDYEGDGAWTIWRKLKARFGRDSTNGGICSFAGDTLVVTDSGYKPIQDIQVQHDKVWARDEQSGKMGWRDVLAQYSNRYEETVHVTAVAGDGKRQTITSNRIHPYFARLAAGAMLATASVAANPAIATEGHVYAGEIAAGAWIDAQHLKAGDALLTQNNEWQFVESVVIEDQPLEAFNLTVDEYATYFVAAEATSDAVWVHNRCYPRGAVPEGFNRIPVAHDPIYGHPIFKAEDGRLLYRGNDGAYRDPDLHPPSRYSDDLSDYSNYAPTHSPGSGDSADDRLPVRPNNRGQTHGVAEVNGETIFFQSGNQGPGQRWYEPETPQNPAVNQSATHVEGHAVGLMIDHGLTDMAVTINNVRGPCGHCRAQLAERLPAGSILTVRWVDSRGDPQTFQIVGRRN